VRELGCSRYNITSLAGIAVFSELIALDLSHNPQIASYQPLYALGDDLGWLWLWDNPLKCQELASLRDHLPRAWIGGLNQQSCA
jgi:hypothetical protein